MPYDVAIHAGNHLTQIYPSQFGFPTILTATIQS